MNTLATLTAKVEASGLSRTIGKMQSYAFVTISAFRKYRLEAYTDKNLLQQGLAKSADKNKWLDNTPEAKKYLKPFKENMTEHRRLMLAVRRYDIFCYQIIGQYPEGGATRKEVSLFCFAPKDKANKFKKIMTELATQFEQDSICYCSGADLTRATDSNGLITESKLKATILEIATSPKEINAKGVSVGTVISKFDGVSVGSLVLGEIDDKTGKNLIQDIFSKVSDRPFYYTGYEEVITPNPKVNGYQAISNIARVLSSKDTTITANYSTGDCNWVKAWILGDITLKENQTIKGTQKWRYGSIKSLL